jgi:hypothetical protein
VLQPEVVGIGTAECWMVLNRGPYGSTSRRTCAAADAARISLLNSGQSMSLPANADAMWLSASVLLLVSVFVGHLLLMAELLNRSRSPQELSVVDFFMTSLLSLAMFSFKFVE